MQKILGLAIITSIAGTAMGQAVSYSTPFTPGTPASLQTSWSGILDGTSPQFRRVNGAGTETVPTTPTTQGGTATSLYRYHVQAYTPATSGLYQFYSAQAFDGYLHLYTDPFNSAAPLTNVLAADDDMSLLNGGVVPNRGGVGGTSDSGFQFNLTGGTTYQIVTTTFSTTTPVAPSNNFYNEIYAGGTAASPTFNIPDNNPAGVTLTLNIPFSETRSIVTFDSLDLTNLFHTYIGDLSVSLKHVDTGTTVIVLDRTTIGGGGVANGSNLGGNYALVDGGAAWPAAATIAPGAYGTSNALSAFAGEALAGTWELFITDGAGADLGSISAFGMNVTVPTPGALALIGLAGLVAGRRRR